MSSTKQLASHICRALRTSQAIQPLHLTRLQRASARSQSANCRSAAWRLQQQNARDFKPVYHHIIASCPHSRQSQQFLKCKANQQSHCTRPYHACARRSTLPLTGVPRQCLQPQNREDEGNGLLHNTRLLSTLRATATDARRIKQTTPEFALHTFISTAH